MAGGVDQLKLISPAIFKFGANAILNLYFARPAWFENGTNRSLPRCGTGAPSARTAKSACHTGPTRSQQAEEHKECLISLHYSPLFSVPLPSQLSSLLFKDTQLYFQKAIILGHCLPGSGHLPAFLKADRVREAIDFGGEC
jgi:hypothetical protein